MLAVNFWAGVMALFFMALVIRGYAGHIGRAIGEGRFWSNGASITAAVIAANHLFNTVRVALWDVAHIGLGWAGIMPASVRADWAALVNTGFAVGSIVISIAALRALFLAIPPAERVKYNLLTAAFYPPRRDRLRFFW